MARFNLQRNRLTLPGRATAVRSNVLDVTTGGQQVAQAVAGFGGALANLGEKYLRIQSATQVSESQRLASEEINRLSLSFQGNLDPDTYQKEYEKSLANIRKLTPKGKLAQTEFNMWLDDRIPFWQDGVAKDRFARVQDNYVTELFERQERHEQTGTLGDFPEFIAKGVSEGMIKREEGVKILAHTRISAQYNAGIKSLEADPENFLKQIDDETFLPKLDAETKSQLKSKARTQMGLNLAMQRDARELAINNEQGRLMQLARKGQMTDEIIRTSQLDEFGVGSKDTFYKILDDLADAALKNKEAPFKESDPEVEARILDEIRDPLSKIKPRDISALVAKGLSIDDADRLIGRMDVYKSFWFGRADRFLKDQLGWSDTYTKFVHPEGAISYHAAMNQLFIDIEEKNLKDKDIYTRAIETGIPYIVDYWSNVLSLEKPQIERMKTMLRGKPVTPKPTEPVGPLREKPKEEFKLEYDPLGIWK